MQLVCNWRWIVDLMQLGCIYPKRRKDSGPDATASNRMLGGADMSQTRIKIRNDKKSSANRRRGAKYWMAVGTVAAYATFGSDAVFKVYAQQDRPAPTVNASGQTQGLTVRRYDIPPGTLDSVLPIFEKTAQFHVTVPRERMRGIC